MGYQIRFQVQKRRSSALLGRWPENPLRPEAEYVMHLYVDLVQDLVYYCSEVMVHGEAREYPRGKNAFFEVG